MAGATIVIAVGYGMVAATLPVLTLTASGPGSFSRAFGFVLTGWGTAGLLAPWLTGALRDWTGSFMTSLVCVLAATAGALLLSLRLRD
jgi:cyanate permease